MAEPGFDWSEFFMTGFVLLPSSLAFSGLTDAAVVSMVILMIAVIVSLMARGMPAEAANRDDDDTSE